MLSDIRELISYRELLWSWVVRDIKVRYKQSLLGIAWAILQPLSATLLFAVIFSHFVQVDTGGIPYPIFYYSAMLPWTLLSSSISFGATALVSNMNLVTKIYFPREIFPIAAVAASFVDFTVASIVFIGMMIFYQVPVSWNIVFVPFIVAMQTILTLGIVLAASALMVFFRDIRFVVPLGLQLWLYATPIIYPVSQVPERWRGLYMLNPMAGFIDSYRRVVLTARSPEIPHLLSAAGISLILFLAAYWYFKRAEASFADMI
jgi:lipopolysaccharide transport system permease protein